MTKSKLIKGDILNPEFLKLNNIDAVFHIPDPTFSCGLSKRIKDEYPSVYQADLDYGFDSDVKLGGFSKNSVNSNTGHITEFFNLYANQDGDIKFDLMIKSVDDAIYDCDDRVEYLNTIAFPEMPSHPNRDCFISYVEYMINRYSKDLVWVGEEM